jgi:farnesyl-diphosphate farnesyltransferase
MDKSLKAGARKPFTKWKQPPRMIKSDSLLRDVSRSFYLTLRVLPARIRPQIGLAYLLARTTDTIADTELLPLEQRLGALEELRSRILGRTAAPIDFGAFARQQGSPAERLLLEQCETSLAALAQLNSNDLPLVRSVFDTITSGQELDLRRFAGSSSNHLLALQSAEELDDYTYRVAGCVGEFWTRICRAHLFPKAALDEKSLLENGVRFGKGLQLVNILRDLPVDLQNGRCYLPASELAAQSLKSQDLLNPAKEGAMRPVYNAWLDRAEGYLRAGWKYTNALPRGCVRLRLACAWPLLIGRETLQLLRTGKVLDPQHRLKVSRRQVRSIMGRSILLYPWNSAWQNLYPR